MFPARTRRISRRASSLVGIPPRSPRTRVTRRLARGVRARCLATATFARAPIASVLGAAALLVLAGCVPDAPRRAGETGLRAGYREAAEALAGMIEREREQKDLAAVSIAVVDRDGLVWAAGFGEQAPGVPASPETAYRVGSVSKLFTDIAVMQLAEAGELDIDAPVADYLPDFAPGGATADNPITLRQLMSHRSGLVREPPQGHYFDDTGTTLAATVASLNGVPLVYEPGSLFKYSNAGVAVAGHVLEAASGEPFAAYVKRAVLDPLGMSSSAFVPEPGVVDDLAQAYMWGLDRPRFEAPGFELGMAPAGSMYSTVLDLARFMEAMFRRGEGEHGRILEPETLESMWEPQYGPPGGASGYGLGFFVVESDGRRHVGHDGAIYGFSTALLFQPDEGIGVVVASAVDGTNTFTSDVAVAANVYMSAARDGEPTPAEALRGTDPLAPELARELEGAYGEGEAAVELDERNGRLFLTPLRGGFTAEVRARGDTLVVDGKLASGARYVRDGTGLVALADAPSDRVPLPRQPSQGLPPPPPAHWEGLIGEYGWDHNVLYVLERHGRLHALIEWFFLYPLEEIERDVYAFPDWGLYHGERLVFSRDDAGRATSVEAASVVFPRREVGTAAGETFRIEPVRPVAELRAEALAASPPAETGSFRDPELVDVTELEPGLLLDVRYATTNNFMSSVFYQRPRVFLQRPAADALVRAHRALGEHGYGLVLYDGYRPWHVTKMFWDATPESQKLFVANPANGSRHNRGSAIDLTLYDLATGQPVEMVGGYDEFSPRSFPDYPGGTSRQRWLRKLLRRTMEAEGFTVYEAEWWHFDHEDWREYPILDLTFGEVGDGSG